MYRDLFFFSCLAVRVLLQCVFVSIFCHLFVDRHRRGCNLAWLHCSSRDLHNRLYVLGPQGGRCLEKALLPYQLPQTSTQKAILKFETKGVLQNFCQEVVRKTFGTNWKSIRNGLGDRSSCLYGAACERRIIENVENVCNFKCFTFSIATQSMTTFSAVSNSLGPGRSSSSCCHLPLTSSGVPPLRACSGMRTFTRSLWY